MLPKQPPRVKGSTFCQRPKSVESVELNHLEARCRQEFVPREEIDESPYVRLLHWVL